LSAPQNMRKTQTKPSSEGRLPAAACLPVAQRSTPGAVETQSSSQYPAGRHAARHPASPLPAQPCRFLLTSGKAKESEQAREHGRRLLEQIGGQCREHCATLDFPPLPPPEADDLPEKEGNLGRISNQGMACTDALMNPTGYAPMRTRSQVPSINPKPVPIRRVCMYHFMW
jgi:hypothetical protein